MGVLVMKCIIDFSKRRDNAVFAIRFRHLISCTLVTSFRHLISYTLVNKTDLFNFKSGHAMQVAKLIKEDCPIVVITVRILAHNNFIVHIYSLVMTLCSRDLLVIE